MAESGYGADKSRGAHPRSNNHSQYFGDTTNELLHKLQEQRKLMLMTQRLWSEQDGQDIAEYAVMMAIVLMLVAATVRLIGSNATNTFAAVGSSIAQ
jgi:Flp pilus assembly pilin Flp